jgi:hypothetical protein
MPWISAAHRVVKLKRFPYYCHIRKEQFEQNKKVIDFDCIPNDLVSQFIEGICKPQ